MFQPRQVTWPDGIRGVNNKKHIVDVLAGRHDVVQQRIRADSVPINQTNKSLIVLLEITFKLMLMFENICLIKTIFELSAELFYGV